MNKKKELVKNSIIIFAGKFCTQFITFLLLPIYTGILSTSEYGFIDLVTTYITLIVPIISLQIELAIFRELIDNRNNHDACSSIITNGLRCILTQFLFCFFLYLIMNLFIVINFKYYLILIALFTMLSNFLLQTLRGFGKNIDYAIASIIAGISNILLNIVFLCFFKMRIEGILLSLILSNLLCIIYCCMRIKIISYISIKNNSNKISKKLLKYSLPLVPNGLIWWVIGISDRTIIVLFLGTASNGIYAISNKFSTVLYQIYSVFNLSWTESAALHINDNDASEFFSEIFNKVVNLSFFVCTFLIAVMPFIFNIIIGINYNNAIYYIPILLWGMFFDILISFLSGIYIAKKLTKEITKTSLMSGIINLVINLLLIKKIGLYAASISTFIAFFVMFLYRIIKVQKYVKISYNFVYFIPMIIVSLFNIVVFYLNLIQLNIINCLLCLLFGLFINKDEFLTVLKILKRKMKKIT